MKAKVARIDDLSDGDLREVVVGEKKVLLIRERGQVRAFGARCPHYGAPLAHGLVRDGRLTCPWHHTTFSAVDGDLLEPPALTALPEFAVEIEDGDVIVDRPDDAKGQREVAMADFDPAADGRTFALIGAGAASAAAAEALRQEGFQGRILMVGREDRWPYDRPNLSKDYLAGEMEAGWLPLRPPAFYEQHDIERLDRRVLTFDVPSRTLQFDDGSTLTPDAVLLAPGAVPRHLDVPGTELGGVHGLRSWDDCEALVEAASRAQRAVVIGASFIGMEAAAALRARGLEVTVVGPGRVPFERILGPAVGAAVRELHAANGVRFRLGRRPAALRGDGFVDAVELDDGARLPAELVVVGIGVTPATDFVHGLTLDEDSGVPVDEQLRAAPGVWAAGDVARYPDPYGEGRLRIEHWRVAMQHGRTAARAMAGRGEPFRGVPFFWTGHFGTYLGYVGAGQGWEEAIVVGDPTAHDFMVFYARGDQVLAACGTRARQLGAFAELTRAGALPGAAELRGRDDVDLTERLQE